ncbi:hypothetical protein A3I58_00420 [Candidatus Peregrinibacteria bacterium RIFCSPLOWO2_02_FULL_39_10]|nr:MAG: hypothetical protein A3I58_00420 [Candidatus Peregrinibacteria bacterium RIFCSPLOWO2_02_FULL_39_10]
MTLLLAALSLILGTAIGSFLSVVIYRVHANKKGIFLSRSICPSCKKQIKWHHLIPVLSWIFLRGKCAYCNQKISVHYMLLEIMMGILFLAIFLKWNFLEIIPSTIASQPLNYAINWDTFALFIFYSIESAFLMTIFFYDLLYKEILDRFSLVAAVIAIAGNLSLELIPLTEMLMGGLSIFGFFAIQYILSKGTWIGGGDLRMGLLMGFLLGLKLGLVALASAYILGGIMSVYLMLTGKVTRKTAIPFGPFLVIGTLMAIFYGKIIITFYTTNILI